MDDCISIGHIRVHVQHYPLRIIPAPVPLSLMQEHMVRL